ncbi:nuclear transport factor 2 family protein [Roseovarius sp. SK2]|uniref:nuclear transport factor 2 family protein n=1 Tax=Roseovarius sp. SK2 TaxID=3028381 RepID=UPI00237B0FFC|nr:nuclear transport factor 2 family protein [Roseovarius sp. SK2]MDD9727721.1 nuclear transport factor 2 family protein [Roseovarius sp. SK2]
MPEDTFTEAMLNDMLAAFNEHDLDRVMSYFAPDAVMIAPAGNSQTGTPIEGADAIASAFETRFAQQPDVAWNEAVSFLSGDRAYTSWRVQAPSAGIDIKGCDVWTFRNGKVIEKDVYYKG